MDLGEGKNCTIEKKQRERGGRGGGERERVCVSSHFVHSDHLQKERKRELFLRFSHRLNQVPDISISIFESVEGMPFCCSRVCVCVCLSPSLFSSLFRNLIACAESFSQVSGVLRHTGLEQRHSGED